MQDRILIIFLLTAFLTAGCVSHPQETGIIPASPPITLPTSVPPPTALPTPPDQAPIVGEWQNGMIFYANRTVGYYVTSGIIDPEMTASWRVNRDEENSYFVVTDKPSELDRARDVTSTEWIYVPASDSIHRKGSYLSVYRK